MFEQRAIPDGSAQAAHPINPVVADDLGRIAL